MKITVKEANIIANALEERKNNIEWCVRKYDEEGNRLEGQYDEDAREYPEYVALVKLIAKIENEEI